MESHPFRWVLNPGYDGCRVVVALAGCCDLLLYMRERYDVLDRFGDIICGDRELDAELFYDVSAFAA